MPTRTIRPPGRTMSRHAVSESGASHAVDDEIDASGQAFDVPAMRLERQRAREPAGRPLVLAGLDHLVGAKLKGEIALARRCLATATRAPGKNNDPRGGYHT